MNLPPELLADRKLGHAAVRVACALWALSSVVDGRAVCLVAMSAIARLAGVTDETVANQLRPGRGRVNSLAVRGWTQKDSSVGGFVLQEHRVETTPRPGRSAGAPGRNDPRVETTPLGRNDPMTGSKRPHDRVETTRVLDGGGGGGSPQSHDLPAEPEPASVTPVQPRPPGVNGQNRSEAKGREPSTVPMFAEVAVPPKPSRRARSRPADPGCTDDQWDSVINAWARARELGGMTAQWGRWKDTDRNRKHAARIWADGHSPEDLMRVMEHIGRGLADGSHDPKWTTLEHVARHVDRYLHEAAAIGGPRPRFRTNKDGSSMPVGEYTEL